MNPDPSSEPTPKENVGLERLQKPWKENRPPKIRGALILVAIVLCVNLLQNLADFFGGIAPIIKSPLWERYTNPGSPKFHPQWKLVIICDAIAVTLILFCNVLMVVFFFRKNRVFPALAVASFPIFFLLAFASHFLGGFIPDVAGSAAYAKQGTALIIKFIAMHIWIPYFLLSKRVAKTFVR
jgi:cobalamin synthase